MTATLLALLVLLSTQQVSTQQAVTDTSTFVAAATNQSTSALLVNGMRVPATQHK